jgi:hypothetical protein
MQKTYFDEIVRIRIREANEVTDPAGSGTSVASTNTA